MALSEELFTWVTQQHLENGSVNLVLADLSSNISAQPDADLSTSYAAMTDLIAAGGYAGRVAQLRCSHVAGHITAFRDYSRARRTVERHETLTVSQQQKKPLSRHVRAMARDLPQRKSTARESIAIFQCWLRKHALLEGYDTQIADWVMELETGEQPKLPKPDNTLMTDALFWKIIADARRPSESETIEALETRLAACSTKSIRDAAKILQKHVSAVYREDVWALAYLLQDGCSDDGFEDFCNWSILQGRVVYECIDRRPDDFEPDETVGADIGAAGGLQSAFENAFLQRSGKPMIFPRIKRSPINPDETRFAEILPSVALRIARPRRTPTSGVPSKTIPKS